MRGKGQASRRRLYRLLIISALVTAAVGDSPVRNAWGALQIGPEGKAFSCPDPSIADVPRFSSSGGRYVEVCTTDMQRDALALYRSNDLRGSWRAVGYVFPAGHQPPWAQSPKGNIRGGRYWSADIRWIENRWVIYFAAAPRMRKLGAFVIGVAWSHSLRGPWHSKLLHRRGESNAGGGDSETYGSVIDPSEAQNPYTKQRYLYWADQHTSIWGAALSEDGLNLSPQVHLLLWAQGGRDCDSGDPRSCCVEGPAAFFKTVNGTVWEYLLYSSRSTWRGTYQMWATAAQDPLGFHARLGSKPILRSGNGWWGPGGGSSPVPSPDGRALWIPYHAARQRLNRQYQSSWRLALVGRVSWVGGQTAGGSPDSVSGLPMPSVGNGVPTRRGP
jgi:hypothetical protein